MLHSLEKNVYTKFQLKFITSPLSPPFKGGDYGVVNIYTKSKNIIPLDKIIASFVESLRGRGLIEKNCCKHYDRNRRNETEENFSRSFQCPCVGTQAILFDLNILTYTFPCSNIHIPPATKGISPYTCLKPLIK